MSAYQRVLIAIDFSPTCKQVLSRGIEVGKQNQSEVFLVHVVEYLPPIDFGYEPIIVPDWYSNEEEIVKQAEKSLKQLANEHAINEQNSIVLTGTPKNEITQFAGDDEFTFSGHQGGFYIQQFSSHLGPGETGDHPDLVFIFDFG